MVLFNDVVDNVGVQIYNCLWPRELFALGLCNHDYGTKSYMTETAAYVSFITFATMKDKLSGRLL